VIRFDIEGIEHFVMQGPRLEVMGSGQSIFIGEGAGESDDLTTNRNVFIGYEAGKSNTTGSNNVANGYNALRTNTTGFTT